MATIFFFFVKKTRKFVLGGIIGGGFAAAVFALGPSRLGLISISEASAYSRVELWYQGIMMIKSNPLFGVGFNMYMNDLPQTAHNSYILAAAELGFVGLFFWMALIYCSYKGLSIVQDKSIELRPYAYGLQSGLIGFCSAAFFLSRTYVIIPYMLFALSGSLFHIAKQKNKDLVLKLTSRDYWNIGYLSIGVILLAYVVLKWGL